MTFGVFIGRFQPLHDAHLAVMLEALQTVETLVLVLGSAWSARTPRNPFTAQEREALIREVLVHRDVPPERVRFVVVRDYYDMHAWAEAVRSEVNRVVPPEQTVNLIGFEKDASSAYLREFPQWPFRPTSVRSPLNATSIRRAFLDGQLEQVEGCVPEAVARFLRGFTRTEAYAELRAEDEFLRDWQAAWRHAPEEPTFTATHALITDGDALMAVRRAVRPGLGLLMLPGGRVHPGLPLRDSAAVHAREQSGWQGPLEWRGTRVFDHPGRSLLGREFAHVHHFQAEPGSLSGQDSRDVEHSAGTLETVLLPVVDALGSPEWWYADHHRILEVMRAGTAS